MTLDHPRTAAPPPPPSQVSSTPPATPQALAISPARRRTGGGAPKRFSRPAHLTASSLIEVLVSLTLASIVFVIAAMVMLQVSGINSPYHQVHQRMTARKLIDQATAHQETQDRAFTIDGIQYFRAIHPLNPETGLYEVTVTACQQGEEPFFKRSKIVHYHAP